MKLLIVLRNIGPYHNSRFESLLNINVQIAVFETRPASKEYLWDIGKEFKYPVYRFPKSDNNEKDISNKDIDIFYKKYIPSINPNVIVSIGWADRSYQRLLLYSNHKGIPIIIVSDSIIATENKRKRSFFKEFIKRIILRGYSSAFVAGKESCLYLEKLGFNKKYIFSPWDVVDNNFFKNYKIKGRKTQYKYFLCVSRLLERKNLFKLIEAFSKYQNLGGSWGLKIIGSGKLYAKINDYSKIIPDKSKFQLLNWLQIDDLAFYYKDSSAFILPSYFDNWGLVVNEAIASGLPCIVSKNCGCAVDLIINKKTGFIFNPLDCNELVYLMQEIENLDERLITEMTNLAKSNLESFNLNIFANNLKKAAYKAIENPKKSYLSSMILRIISLI